LKDYSLYFGLILPISLILFINFVILVAVMGSLGKRSNGGSLAHTGKKLSLLRQSRIAFACSVLLGLTWLFALVAIGDARNVFQWLFTVFNSLQGLFIFTFYTLLNPDARKEWMACCQTSQKSFLKIKNSPKCSPRKKVYIQRIKIYPSTSENEQYMDIY